MTYAIYIEKKHILTIVLLVMAVVSFGIVSAAGGPLVQFTPLSQITSDDAGFNVIDNGSGYVKAEFIDGAVGGSVPSGGIIMWSGSYDDIPVGWALADGSQGTPDLRAKFIYGVNAAYSSGNDGSLNTNGGSLVTAVSDNSLQNGVTGHCCGRSPTRWHTHTFMPPYYTLAFIMKL